MSKIELLNKIIYKINDVSELGNRFNKNKQIPKIEIDLALSKIRNLYDLLLLFDDANKDSFEQNVENPITEKIKESKEKSIKEKQNTNIVEKENSQSASESEQNGVYDNESDFEIVDNNEEKIIVSENDLEEENSVKSTAPNHRAHDEEKIVADKFHKEKFMHDNISNANKKNDLSMKIQAKKIKDINLAIGMNDKFMFIRELFGGDKQQYIDTIQILNNFDSYDNAYNFISEHFDWNRDDANLNKLLEIIKKRYS
jgi:hypothetical protein